MGASKFSTCVSKTNVLCTSCIYPLSGERLRFHSKEVLGRYWGPTVGRTRLLATHRVVSDGKVFSVTRSRSHSHPHSHSHSHAHSHAYSHSLTLTLTLTLILTLNWRVQVRAGVPRKALRGVISKSILQRSCQFLAIHAHKMAPITT